MAAPDLIIGLGHRKRVGKDTFAGFLEEALRRRGYHVFRLGFAQTMKSMAESMFSWAGLQAAPFYETYPEKREEVLPDIGKTPRQIWIEFGNAMRVIQPDTWVKFLEMRLEHYLEILPKRPKAFIITDVRFRNEAAAIKARGGHLAIIRRKDAPVAANPAGTALEWYTGWDRIINNNGTLEQLAEQAADYAYFLTSSKG